VTETGLYRLRQLVRGIGTLLDGGIDEDDLLARGSDLMRQLVSVDDWLRHPYSAPDPTRYQQYLLHCDSLERFSVVSFVWGPGQATPVHDHKVWGIVGMLRGAEISQRYRLSMTGLPVSDGKARRLEPGDVEIFSPRLGDIHKVMNASSESTSISIHVYGANIGAIHRTAFDDDGFAKPFVSRFSKIALPNIWIY
jgi:predicted metal-dependent enzyme (double-stranded beta helix superfamily)